MGHVRAPLGVFIGFMIPVLNAFLSLFGRNPSFPLWVVTLHWDGDPSMFSFDVHLWWTSRRGRLVRRLSLSGVCSLMEVYVPLSAVLSLKFCGCFILLVTMTQNSWCCAVSVRRLLESGWFQYPYHYFDCFIYNLEKFKIRRRVNKHVHLIYIKCLLVIIGRRRSKLKTIRIRFTIFLCSFRDYKCLDKFRNILCTTRNSSIPQTLYNIKYSAYN